MKWFYTRTAQGSSGWGSRGKVVWLPTRGNRLLSQANCSAIFLAANVPSDAFSIWFAGLQDTSRQLLLGEVTDVCRVLAKCELPTRVAGQEPTRSPASPGTLLSVPGEKSRARQAGSTRPHVGAGYVCVTGQIVSSFAGNNIIMEMTSAAVIEQTFPTPNQNQEWVGLLAELSCPGFSLQAQVTVMGYSPSPSHGASRLTLSLQLQ